MSGDMLPAGYHRSVERPAILIKTALTLILSVALAIALIVKAYALALTDYVCVAYETTIGNLIRCAGSLEIVAGFLAMAAGLEVAAALAVRGRRPLQAALTLGIASGLFALLAKIVGGAHDWRIALLFAALAAAVACLNVDWLRAFRRASTEQDPAA